MKRITLFLILLMISALLLSACKNHDGGNAEENGSSDESISYLEKKDGTYLAFIKDISEISEGTIDRAVNGKPITEIIIDENVGVIGSYAFYGFTELRSITIGADTFSIMNSAFKDCIALSYVQLPDRLMYIGESAFFRCIALERITVPDGVQAINENTFAECTSLREVLLPDGLKAIKAQAFLKCTALEEIFIGENVNYIGCQAFSKCTSMTNAQIQDANGWTYSSASVEQGIATDIFSNGQSAANALCNTYCDFVLKKNND